MEWISVEDRLPSREEAENMLLIWPRRNGSYVALYDAPTDAFMQEEYINNYGSEFHEIAMPTHWCKIEPPEKAK